MSKSTTIAALIFGASIGAALLKFYSLPKDEKDELLNHIKKTTNDLLDNAEDTVEKVEHFMGEIKSKGEKEWIDKLYVVKKMLTELYGSNSRYLS